jgi:GNAT superfamily N-acetyltransferase
MSALSASIRQLSIDDLPIIIDIINTAAKKYGGVIPADCYHEPYMAEEELAREMTSMTFYGFLEDNKTIGVAGFQPVADVTLIRHAYVRPEHQRKGIGAVLLDHLKNLTRTRRLLVGTWASAQWAVDFYEKQGFGLLTDKDNLLARYWKISPRQIETSVVLGMELEGRE